MNLALTAKILKQSRPDWGQKLPQAEGGPASCGEIYTTTCLPPVQAALTAHNGLGLQ